MFLYECVDERDFNEALATAEFYAQIGFAHEISYYFKRAQSNRDICGDKKFARKIIKSKLTAAREMLMGLNFQNPRRVDVGMQQIVALAKAEAGIK